MEAKRHEVIDDMINTVKAVILEIMPDSDEDLADIISNEIADRFTDKWAKATIYIPEDINYKVNLKNIEIFEEYKNGKPIREIALSRKISVQHAYSIINKMRDQHIRACSKFCVNPIFYLF